MEYVSLTTEVYERLMLIPNGHETNRECLSVRVHGPTPWEQWTLGPTTYIYIGLGVKYPHSPCLGGVWCLFMVVYKRQTMPGDCRLKSHCPYKGRTV